MANKTELKNYLLENVEELKDLVNELNSWDGSLEHLQVHENDEDFFETFFSGEPDKAVRAAFYGDYNYSHDLVRFNGYANLDSLSYYDYEEELKESIDEIIENLEDNAENIFVSDEVTALLNEEEEEEE